jgi:hypothetical protein
MNDWRLNGQDKYLSGVNLVRRPYKRYSKNPSWDHDHCEFCFAKFMVEDVPGVLHVGYSTEDEYRWICDSCFAEFKEQFRWVVIADETLQLPRSS